MQHSPAPMTLRDALLSSLSTFPGTRDFYIHVLVSSPRKHSGLFPYAHPRPRVYLQDILILLSERSSPDSPRILVTAVEVSVYNVPSSSCGILYVSKVDSTGQGASPSPTATLVQGLLSYYANPETRPIAVNTLWIQLFARAQGQYLFPNSSEYQGKHPLSDVKLCAWWKKVFAETAGRLESGWAPEEGKEKARKGGLVKLYYLLPGYSELEAVHSLNIVSSVRSKSSASSAVQWIYGHPYVQNDIPLPCTHHGSGSGIATKGKPNLGHYIPSFDDDPKSRFLDDLAHTLNGDKVRSPKRKRPKTTIHRKPSSKASNGSKPPPPPRDADLSDEEEEEEIREGELNKVSPDEFWERMSFRQECVSGAITGFFALGISDPQLPEDSHESPTASPLAPQPGQVAPRLLRRVVSSLMTGSEFSTRERAIRATSILEESIKGLCENIAEIPITTNPNLSSTANLVYVRDAVTPERDSAAAPVVPPSDTLEVPRTPPAKGAHLPDISPNPFPEPEASLETYRSYIYGSISVKNPPLPPKDGPEGTAGSGEAKPVTVLAVRKKKRKVVDHA